MGFRKIFLILFFLMLMCGGAHAGVSYNQNVISISYPTTVYDLPSLYSQLVAIYNESYTQTNILNETSPGVWRCSMFSIPATIPFYINSSTASEVRMMSNSNDWAIEGYPILNNTKLVSWNREADIPNTFSTSAFAMIYTPVHDVEFDNFKNVYFGYQYGNAVTDLTYYNISLNNTKIGLSFQRANNITADNITIKNGGPTTGNGLALCVMNNSIISNLTVTNISDYINPSSMCYAIFLNGDNNTIKDAYLNGTGWSGINVGGADEYNSVNLTMKNITMINSGHNGFEIEINDSHFENITVMSSNAFNFFVSGRGETHKTIKEDVFENITSINPGGAGFYTGEGCTDILISNSTFYGKGFSLHDSKNITVINLSQSKLGDSIGYGEGYTVSPLAPENMYANWMTNYSLIDSKFTDNAGRTDLYLLTSSPVKAINTLYSTLVMYYSPLFYNSDYLDVVTKDGTGSLVTDAVIDVSNTVTPNDGLFNGWANNASSFSTTGGRTYLPTINRELSPAIADKRGVDTGALINQNYSFTSSASIGSVTLDNIDPDFRWYRSTPANSKYTIVAIINDSTSTHFTGYAPSTEYNSYNVGDSVKFQIWANEPLTSVSWKRDNTTVQSGGMTYEATIGETPITVDIIGESANGSVSKTWVVDPYQIIDPDPEGVAPVADFTANTTSGTYPAWVSFTDSSTESPTNWYWDLDNDGHVDSRNQNATCKYKVPGNYTVKLTVSNSAGMDFETKTDYINVTGTQPERKHFFVSFSDWFNSFIRQYFGGA